MLEYSFIQFTNGKIFKWGEFEFDCSTKKDGSEFENQYFNNSVFEYDFVSKLEDAKAVSIKQDVTLDSLPEEYKNVVSVVGTNNTSKNVIFRSGVFTLISGKNINSKDKNSILIHSDLAKRII